MRILKLNPPTEKLLLARRARRDSEAHGIAAEIVADLRKRGDAALFAWTKKLDSTDLASTGVWVSQHEVSEAEMHVSPRFVRAVKKAAANIRAVARKQLPRDWTIETACGVRIRQLVRPIGSIGCYIPGGRHSLVSTLVMIVVPAKVAGVSRIVAVCPKPSAEMLVAARILGVTEVARIGGAQAIAALAYGTKSIPQVQKIFGPGNAYVTAAKQLVSHDCAIDMPAGPTEAIVFANRGNPHWIAADLLAQAEHAEDAASFFITTSHKLARDVQSAIDLQLQELPGSAAAISTGAAGAILLADSADQACEFINRFAPEHLSLPENGEKLLRKIDAAGTVFLGPWSAQALGDYATGSNHVLPTFGWARSRGGLSAADFVKCISVQTVTRSGFRGLAGTTETLAESEGLLAHRQAVRIRQ